jgi:ribonuclease D
MRNAKLQEKEKMHSYTLISNDSEFDNFLKYLIENKITQIAIDFEGESNLHSYGEKLCLIQIFDNSSFFLIDPFNINSTKLKIFLENSLIEKLGYSSISDCKQLYKQYGIKIKALYDIQIMVDVLHLKQKGLDAVLETELGIVINKKKHFQMYNWTTRPIRKDAMDYALSDVEHLFKLKEKLQSKIIKLMLSTELENRITNWTVDYNKKSIPTIKKDNRYLQLNFEQKILFDKLYDFREQMAKKLDLPPNMVLDKTVMFNSFRDSFSIADVNINGRIPSKSKIEIIEFIKSIN